MASNFPIGDGADNNGVNTIPNGLPAALMRESMENKNLLQQQGAIYAGTGDSNSIVVQGDAGSPYTVAKTAAVPPPTGEVKTGADTYVLTYIGNTAVPDGGSNVSETGLMWQMMSSLGIKGKVGIVTAAGGSTDVGTWSGSATPYTYTIPAAKHNLGATSNIFVQLMMGSNPFEIVSSTIKVSDDGTVAIQSNIKWSGKVLLFAIT